MTRTILIRDWAVMIRSITRASLSFHILWLLVLSVGAAGCTPPVLAVPSIELERLLELPPSTSGLTEEQSAALRSVLATSKASRYTLELHIAEESRRLVRLLGDGEPVMGPAIWTQAGLVYQLRTERLLAPVLLRERTQSVLTPAQQIWWARNRLNLVFPQ